MKLSCNRMQDQFQLLHVLIELDKRDDCVFFNQINMDIYSGMLSILFSDSPTLPSISLNAIGMLFFKKSPYINIFEFENLHISTFLE